MKRIVIMGATSGIGLETAKRCIAAGWRVGAAGRRSEELERLRGLAPQQVETEAIDVTDDAAPAALERLIERLGGMDVYFHVAGVGSQNPQLDPTVELHTVRTNVEGFTRMTTAAYGYFAAHGGGRIAVVSSIAGTRGLGVAAAYSASKRFQNTYIDSLAQLARMQGSKIRFTDIRPGFVATALLRNADYPMLMRPEKVAETLFRALECGKRRIVIDHRYALLVRLWRLIPQGGSGCRSAAEHRIRLDQPGIVPSRTVPVIHDTHIIRSSDSEQSRIAKQYIDSPYEAADRTHPNPRDTDLSRR